MEGIRLSGQTLYAEDKPENILQHIHSILVSKDMEVQGYQGGMKGENFLNSIEVNVQPYQNGTTINVEHGMTTVGLILAIIGLIAFVILGVVVVLIWYMKFDDIKGSLKSAFPAFMPPPPHMQQNVQQQGPPPQ